MLIEVSKLYRVAFCDPKGANPNTRGTSRAAIVCVGMDDLERIYILQSWAAYCGADEILRRVFKFDEKWTPNVFGIDTTATQSLWMNLIRKEAEFTNKRMPKMRGVIFRGEKTRVIETIIQPRASKGQLFRPPEVEVKELASEFKAFPTGMHRDAMDALAHAIDLLPLRPPVESQALERDSYRRYLMRIGMSEQEIRTRMAEIGQ